MTWETMLESEPKLKDLYEKALLFRDQESRTPDLRDDPAARVDAHLKSKCFCKERMWSEKFEPEVSKLVGPKILSSSGMGKDDVSLFAGDPLALPMTYGIARDKFLETLPHCRNCEHDDAVQAAHKSGEIKELKNCLKKI